MIRDIGIVLMLAAPIASAQTSELYINQYDSPAMVVVQGGSVVRSWNTQNTGENALAVAHTIRTAGNWVFGNSDGAEYDLFGIPQGGPFAIFGPGFWLDGTTDGQSCNYAVQFGTGDLYRFSLTWSNPQFMFNVGPTTSGITYDERCGTFWVVEPLIGLVQNIDQSGNVLSSFLATQHAIGIARDPADGTLWVGSRGSSVILQYDTAGNLLSTVVVPGIANAHGMEFDLTACYADFDGNGLVDTRDVLAFLNLWSTGSFAADCNCDGVINSLDILCLLNRWVAGC